MSLELKLPGHVAGVEAGVVQGDVEHSDGHVLQVFAPVPLQAPWKGSSTSCWPFHDTRRSVHGETVGEGHEEKDRRGEDRAERGLDGAWTGGRG